MGLQTLEHFLITQPVTIFFDFLIVHHHNEEKTIVRNEIPARFFSKQ